jgi:hypothetical protein
MRKRLTLDGLATYQITVPGKMDPSGLEWAEGMLVSCGQDGDSPPVTILTGTFDQAGLHGILRRLYALGLPLISVTYIGQAEEDSSSDVWRDTP